MKKILLSFLAVMALVLTGCKIENADVTVTVMDTMGAPVANRYVFFTDKASAIMDAVLPPTPTELIDLESESWSYVVTNKLGTVSFTIPMLTSSLTYYFIVFDEGSNSWKDKEVKIQRGKNEEIVFEVNR